jgi:SAM-dependent methyltransferase
MAGTACSGDTPNLGALSTGCRLDPWFSDVLRDPLSKDRLLIADGAVMSSWGRRYPAAHGILDLRLYGSENGVALREWSEGQIAYEAFSEQLVTAGTAERYLREIDGVRQVYEEIPILGSCLDVGGFDGRVRHFMPPDARYACVEPYIFAIRNIARQPVLTSAYPELKEPCNFVGGHAEHLPIAGEVFDTVHMRSVIDHFINPLLALMEAARVLRPGGQLIVGISVEGGSTGIPSAKERLREIARSILVGIGMERFRDHHIWHPTFPALKDLIIRAGFSLGKVHWQASEGGRVVYVQAHKPSHVF